MITEAFSLAGITIFTSFQPTEVANDDGTCSRAGKSHIFIVGTVTALGYDVPDGDIDNRARYHGGAALHAPRRSSSRAPPRTPKAGGNDTQRRRTCTESLKIIREELKTLQSTRCRYANYTHEHQDDPLRHRTGLHRPGSGLHRSDELEGVLMVKTTHRFCPRRSPPWRRRPGRPCRPPARRAPTGW